MLKRLEIAGFKSFAKKTTIEFNAPVTAIVGPNGSGKSNVAEALRWVLGEQSMKSLRGKRGEDLIWNGSRDIPRINHASVAIVFDNRGKKFALDFEEVIIARHVYRDGQNEYFVNGSRVRLKDVIELLGVVGIGATSHHIINQGEADRFLSASPLDRREMIEEALGLRVYQGKRIESQKKLDKTEENLRQVAMLRKEIAPHVKFLRRQVEKYEQAEVMRQELRSQYVHYFAHEHKAITEGRASLRARRAEPERELHELEQTLATQTTEQATLNGDREAMHEAEKSLYNARLKKEELVRESGRVEGKLEALGTTKQFSGETVCDACGQVIGQMALTRMEHRKKEFERLTLARGRIQEECATVVAEERMFTQKVEQLSRTMEREQEKVRESERRLYEARSRRNELGALCTAFAVETEALTRRTDEYERDVAEATHIVGPRIREWGSLLAEMSQHEGDVDPVERRRRIEKLKIRLEDVGGEETAVRHEYNEVSARETFLARETEDLQRSVEGLHTVINELEMRIREEFTSGISKINEEFQRFFGVLFGGGTASLDLVEHRSRRQEAPTGFLNAEMPEGFSEEKPEEGIEVAVSLPRKKVRGLDMLSGGERALTSIALLFAMSQVNPPPFLLLDETDAALDESNSKRYADMVETLAARSQLIVVTHNRETMSRAHILYGVTMGGDGVSRLLSVRLAEAEQLHAAH